MRRPKPIACAALLTSFERLSVADTVPLHEDKDIAAAILTAFGTPKAGAVAPWERA